MSLDFLIHAARRGREKAYAPYSGVKVGAALETEGGKIFSGCNIENASYGLSNCAERTAIYKAVSEGFTRFKRIAIVTKKPETFYPCGACRQVMIQFSPDMEVIVANTQGKHKLFKARELLPHPFLPKELLADETRKGTKGSLQKTG